MTRCDYDVIFYRVFCLSLLVIAFIFTVILTNVFVDIDGLLSKKEKSALHNKETYEESTANLLREMKPEVIFNEERNYEDAEDAYRKDDVFANEEESFRNKRSLESNSFLFHLQNPNLKNVLTNHLNALLEQLDAEEFSSNSIDDRKTNEVNEKKQKKVIKKHVDGANAEIKTPVGMAEINNTEKVQAIIANVEINNIKDNKSKTEDNMKTEDKSQKEMLHLAMHDILLQGIIGHMDLNEVYRKINVLSKKMENPDKKIDKNDPNKEVHKILKQQEQPNDEEDKFFEELTKCKELQNEIRDALGTKETKYKTQKAGVSEKPMLIKAVIDISATDGTRQWDSISNTKDVQGLIKFKYNGKPVKVKIVTSTETNSVKSTTVKSPKSVIEATEKLNQNDLTNQETSNKNDETDALDSTPIKFNIPQSYLNRAIANYFKKYENLKNNPNEYSKNKKNINNKRFKRHIKIHYDPNNKTKSEDDELYVEIETHFDSKGMRGEKRKKMIRNLIEKIEKAIHSNVEPKSNKTKKHYHAHVKKRIQNPLAVENIIEQRRHDSTLVFKKLGTLKNNNVERRHLNPIGKSYKLVDANKNEVPGIYNKVGDSWKKAYSGPGFLQPSKSLNSAELSEVDVDYNRVMTFNGIPQRLQKPLNTDNSDEALATNYYDLGNLQFFVKDLDHSGISVGFNQYTDEEPDPETIKIFTGVDNLVKAYNHNYGKAEPIGEYNPESQMKNQYDYNSNSIIPDDHNIIRRAALEEDYHSNEYKMVYDNHYLPYKSYQEIFGIKMNNRKKFVTKSTIENSTEKSLTMDIFDKKLKPSEIFSLANMLGEYRKKRSLTVKKYSNLNTRRRLNKFLQTKTNKLFINKKRMKRHIDKIRIIATDKSGLVNQVPYKRPDDRNIFVVSNEDDYSSRAVLREILPEEEENSEKQERPEKLDEIFDYNVDEDQAVPKYVTHVFDGRSRHNPLMSKYPHVFMEEISKSKENDMTPAIYGNVGNVMSDVENKYNFDQYEMPVPVFEPTTENSNPILNISTPKFLLQQEPTKARYKLSVKIIPKNISQLKSGFKEIHTSINKSYDKDGLRFYSLVNVSEISKVENIENPKNKGKKINNTIIIPTTTENPRLKAQQFKIKSILKRHKQMIDMQLDHLNKERDNLDSMLVSNQSYSDEILDIRLPGESHPLQIKKSELSKLLATVLKSEQNEVTNPVTSSPQPTTQPTTKPTTQPTTTVTPKPVQATVPNAPNPMPMKATDKKLINIIEKNGKLTKEILNKIDRNTEMLEAFLVKLVDKIEDRYEKSTVKSLDYRSDINKREKPLYPVREDINVGKPTENKNDSKFSIPFIYAYQHPYIDADKPDSPVANVVYQEHIHPEMHNTQELPNDVAKTPKLAMTKTAPNGEMKVVKSKFFFDNDMTSAGAVVKPTKYLNPPSTLKPLMRH